MIGIYLAIVVGAGLLTLLVVHFADYDLKAPKWLKSKKMENKQQRQSDSHTERTRIVIYCKNCMQCRFDSQRGLVCGLTNEPGKFEHDCEQFEPNEAYIAKKRAEKSEKERSEKSDGEHFIVIILTYFWCLVSMLWGEKNFTTTVWTLLAAGFVLAGGGTAYYLYRRSQLKKITFGRLTKKNIMELLRIEGYQPHQDADGDIGFKANGDKYWISYDAPKFILRSIWPCKKEDIDLMRAIANKVMQDVVVVKVLVSDYIEEQKTALIAISVEALISYEAELSEQLPNFFQIIETLKHRISEIQRHYEVEQVASQEESTLRRRDIYNKEYGWLAGVVDAVSDGQLTPVALSDEDWLRKNMQQECVPSMQAEWNAFRIVRVDNYGDYRLILYQFPEPKEVPEALYGAVLLDTTTHKADYYTLEYSANGKWVLGSTSRSKHSNYGEIDTPDLEQFIAWIFNSNKQLCYYTDMYGHETQKVN